MAQRTINITGVNLVHSGTSANGNAWNIYEIHALDAEGSPIDLPLRAFDELPYGEGTYEIEPYVRKGETTYTLKKPGSGGNKSPGARLGPKVDELRTAVENLEQAVASIKDRLSIVEERMKPTTAAPAATPVADGDDIPF